MRSVLPLLLALSAGWVAATWSLPFAAVALFAPVVLLLTLRRPLIAVALMLIAGPWGALENVALGGSLLDSGQLLFLFVVALWLARGVLRRRVVIPHAFLNLPLALFLGVAVLSLLDATSLTFGLKELLKWIEVALVMWIVIDLAGDDAATVYRRPLALFLLAGLTQAAIGVWQFGLRGDGPEHFLILDRFYRAYGTFEQPNPFAGFMAWNAALGIGTFVGLIVAFWHGRKELDKREWAWLLFIGGCAAASTLALLLSWSRGAWLGFAAAMAVFLLFWPRRAWLGPVLLLAAIGLFALGWQLDLVPAPLVNRLAGFTDDLRVGDVRGVDINDANYAVIERLAHWQSAVDMARNNLWLGVGFGNYEPAYDDYALINWPFPLGHAHNYYLNILAETGVLGTAAYLLFWAAVFWKTLGLLRRLGWPERGVVLGLLAAWTALSVHHLLDKLYVNNLYLHLGVMFGILQLLAAPRPGPSESAAGSRCMLREGGIE
ncbi:MAG: O-antigen ligase family protein [Candidatus Promineifilaceae bacterium]|nr:O-antigen ligase family protein [Candidatus Promineifilaceae bacterium]